jgi:uncharacterized protein (DUF2147 family)
LEDDTMKILLTAAALMLTTTLAAAQASPVGLWRTIDDETKQEKSLVRISDTAGTLSGKVEKIADATKQDSKCDECTDDRKGKPVVGMVILRDLKKGDADTWEGGSIVDPANGKVYKATIKLIDGGKKLQMRGYIGPFFRTQTWLKAD